MDHASGSGMYYRGIQAALQFFSGVRGAHIRPGKNRRDRRAFGVDPEHAVPERAAAYAGNCQVSQTDDSKDIVNAGGDAIQKLFRIEFRFARLVGLERVMRLRM